MYFKILTLFFVLFSNSVFAHTKSISSSVWKLNGERLDVSFSIKVSQLQNLYKLAKFNHRSHIQLSDYLLASIKVQGCTMGKSPVYSNSSPQYAHLAWDYHCKKGTEDLKITNSGFYDLNPNHTHILHFFNGPKFSEFILSKNSIHALVELKGARTNHISDFFKAGFNHIFEGLDHLIFIFALILTVISRKKLLILISGFTAGHFLALFLSRLGLVLAQAQTVESLIGLSICLLCYDFFLTGKTTKAWGAYVPLIIATISILAFGEQSLLFTLGISIFLICHFQYMKSPNKNDAYQIILTILIGVIHGLGFTSFLYSVSKATQLETALAFNFGVEAGQLAFVSLILLLVFGIKRLNFKLDYLFLKKGILSLISGIGIFWFVERALRVF
jgi:hypothetical protein